MEGQIEHLRFKYLETYQNESNKNLVRRTAISKYLLHHIDHLSWQFQFESLILKELWKMIVGGIVFRHNRLLSSDETPMVAETYYAHFIKPIVSIFV